MPAGMSGFTLHSTFPGTIPKSQALTAVLAAMFFGECADSLLFHVHLATAGSLIFVHILTGAFTMIAPPALYVIR